MHLPIQAGPAPNGTGPDSTLRAEQLSLLTRNRADQYAGIPAAAITVYLVHHLYPAWLLALWFGLSCLILPLRADIGRRYHASGPTPQSLRLWHRLITGGIVVTGLLWGLSATAILLSPASNIVFFIIMMTSGMAAGGASSNAAYRPAIIGLALSVQLPVIAALLARNDPSFTGIAVLLATFTALIINSALKSNRVIADNIRMRFAQEALLFQAQSSAAAMAEAQQLAKTGSWVRDLRTNIVTLSPEAYRIFGIDPANLTPDFSVIEDRIHPDDKALVAARAAKSRLGHDNGGIDHRIITDDGTVKYLHVTPRPILDAAGRTIKVNGSIQDVTARRAVEDRLHLSNLLLKTQMEASPDGIQVSNAKREMISFNQQFAEIWRVPAAEMKIGSDAFLRPHMIAQVKSPESYVARIQHLIDHPDEMGAEEVHLADGRILERHTRPLRTETGEDLGRVWFFRDITARHQAAQKLEFANIVLNTQMEASRDGILILDSTGKIIALNRRYGEMSKARFDDLIGQDFSVSVARVQPLVKDLGAFLSRVTDVVTNPFEASEAEFETNDGRFISRYMTPLRAANGDYLGRAWFYSDITERKQAADTLAYRDHLLHTVTAATAIAVGALSVDDGVAAALAQVGTSMGVERILILQKMPGDIPPAVRFQWEAPAVPAAFTLAATGLYQFDLETMEAWRAPLKDGKPVFARLETASAPVRAMMEFHGIRSCLLMPVFVGGVYWGFLGIDACAAARDWAAAEIETLGILADIAGSLIVRERARVALATSEQRFRLLTSTARDAVTLTDEAAIILQWNGAAERVFGYTAAEAIGQNAVSLLGKPGQRAEIVQALKSITEAAGLTMELSLRRKNGSEIAVEISISAARIGVRLEFITIMRDVTERKTAAEKLQFANILLNTQMEASPDGILVVDSAGRITAVNHRYGAISGTRTDDLPGLDFSAAFDRMSAVVKDASAFLRRVSFRAENAAQTEAEEFEMADGRFISRYMTPLHTADGAYLGRATFYTDITERKNAADTLAYRDRLLHTVTAATAVAVGALSLADGVAAALAKIGDSMAVDRILVFRKEPDEAQPLSVLFAWESEIVRTEFKLPDPALHIIDEAALAEWRRPLDRGKPVIAQRATAAPAIRAAMMHHGAESVLLMPVLVGGGLWGFLGIDACAAPRDWAPAEIETVSVLADITGSLIARERARIALQTSELRYRQLTATAIDAVMLTDEAATIHQWNDAAEHMLGYTAADAIGRHVVDLIVPPRRAAEIGAILQAITEHAGVTMEIPVRRKDGAEREMEISVSAARLGARLEYITVMRDITERKNAERKLQFANILLGMQMEASPDGIVVADPARKMVSCNQRFAEMWHLTAEMLTSGDDDARRNHIIAQVMAPETYKSNIDYLASHPHEVGEDEIATKDGRTLERYSRSLISPDGEHLGRVTFFRDITERKNAARKLQFANILLGTQMEASPDGIIVADPERNFVSCNQRFGEMWRIQAAELRPGNDPTIRALMMAQVAVPDAYAAMLHRLTTNPDEIGEDEIVTADGRIFERYTHPLISPDGERLGRVSFFGDMTARKTAEQKLMVANSLMKTQMEAAPDGIYALDSAGRILSCNQRFAEMWGIPPAMIEEGRTMDVRDQTASLVQDPEPYLARIAYLIAHPGETGDDELVLTDGRIIERHSVSIRTAGQENLGRVWFCRDVTARRAADALALRLARYDVLTGLANRAVFVEAIHHAIAHARREGTGFAVLFLDLDHFKDVNDTLGHPAGDALLKGVAARLLGATRETDTVGRFGGDEFAVILSGIEDAAGASLLAEKLLNAINIPLVIELNTVHVRASIGIELFSPSADDSETLLAHADVALYRAKAEGRGTFRFFTAAMDRDLRGRVTLGTELREALGAGEFLVLYQPQVDACSGLITGVEALIRWRHPTRGLLTPSTFIEAAEATGVITQLGHFVLWTACRQAAAWLAAGIAPPRLSFNVSALQFKSSRTLEADIIAALAETGLPPAMLELELTESALMSTSQENNNVLRRLKDHGVKLAIDDFGTGYSSLEYLRRFPADHIKIARAFTKNVATEAGDAAIVRAIIGLAGELNITTIAQGIETRAQLDRIANWGCTQMQGFYISRPLPADKMTALLSAGATLLPSSDALSWPSPGLTG